MKTDPGQISERGSENQQNVEALLAEIERQLTDPAFGAGVDEEEPGEA